MVVVAGRWVSCSGGSRVRGRSVGIFMQGRTRQPSKKVNTGQPRYLLIGSGFLQDSTAARMIQA